MRASRTLASLLTLFAVAGGASCGSNESELELDAGADASAPDADDEDAGEEDAGPACPSDPALGAAPTVVSFSPESGAAGVLRFDPITITFSEPMDPATTEAAITLETTAPAALLGAMTWNAEGTVLQISANNLEKTGSSPEDAGDPYTFTYTVGPCAESAAGNPMGEAASVTFATARAIVFEFFEEVSPLFGHSTDGGGRYTFLCAGDDEDDEEIRALVTYDISAIPEEALGISTSFFSAGVYTVAGDPHGELGELLIEHVVFESFADGWGAPLVPGHSLLPLHPAGTPIAIGTNLTQTVTLAVRDDWEHRAERGHRSQYRFRFAGAPSENGARDRLCMRAGDTPANPDTETPPIAGAKLSILYLIE